MTAVHVSAAAPGALLRRGADDLGTFVVLAHLPDGTDTEAVTRKVLEAGSRLRAVGGGEVVLDARATTLTGQDAAEAYRKACTATGDRGLLPAAVTVILGGRHAPFAVQVPEPLRADPPVRLHLRVDATDHGSGVAAVAAALNVQPRPHREDEGATLVLRHAGRSIHLISVVEPVPGAPRRTQVEPPLVLRVRSDDEQHLVQDATALQQFLHARTGWRTLLSVGGISLRELPGVS